MLFCVAVVYSFSASTWWVVSVVLGVVVVRGFVVIVRGFLGFSGCAWFPGLCGLCGRPGPRAPGLRGGRRFRFASRLDPRGGRICAPVFRRPSDLSAGKMQRYACTT